MPRDSTQKRLARAIQDLRAELGEASWHAQIQYETDDVEGHAEDLEQAILACVPRYPESIDTELSLFLLHRTGDDIEVHETTWTADELASFCIRILTMLRVDGHLDSSPTWIQTLMDDDEDEDDEEFDDLEDEDDLDDDDEDDYDDDWDDDEDWGD